MKKLILYLLSLVVFYQTSIAQSCLPDGITFNTQDQIDTFASDYPNCVIIEGDVIIDDGNIGNIHNLNGLSNIKKIIGDLLIKQNPDLLKLSGLQNLQHIELGLRIEDNVSLKGFKVFDSLHFVGNTLVIMNNDSILNLVGFNGITQLSSLVIAHNDRLENFEGLNNLNSITYGSDIAVNKSLKNFKGLDNLKELGHGWLIYGNSSLQNFDGLDSLNRIMGDLRIKQNKTLTDLNGLINVDSIDGYLSIKENDILTTIDGLRNIDSETIRSKSSHFEDLTIRDNNSLSECSIDFICSLLLREDATTDIRDNKEGCNNPEEVELNCTSGVTNIHINYVNIHPNPASSQITIDAPESHNWQRWRIYSIEGKEILTGTFSGSKDNTISGLEKMKAGVYILELISQDGHRAITKFNKQ